MRRDERGNIAVVLVCGGEVCPWGHAFFGWSFLIMLTFCEGFGVEVLTIGWW